MSKQQNKVSAVIPTPEEDLVITAGAKTDPDAHPLTDEQLQATVPLQTLRGRPKSEHKKQLVSIRYSPEVLEHFKASGSGWQARMDEVLKEYIANLPLRGAEEA